MTKGMTVRLTDEAHALLAEKAKNIGNPMKTIASEAIISLFKRELKLNAYMARINGLEKEVDASKRYVLFVLGITAGLCLATAYFVGMI